jgi:hypothetical protein
MSTHAASIPGTLPSTAAAGTAPAAGKALVVGLAGIGLTAVGIFISGGTKVAAAWLTAMTFWTGIAIGMLLLVMIHHIFDASWSTVIRRQFEHALSSFKWLAILFSPLIIASLFEPTLVWKWFSPHFDLATVGGHGSVGEDPLWQKKAILLNPTTFIIGTFGSYLLWIWLSARLRKASFSQDVDGSPAWTRMNRVTSAFGIPIAALTLSICVILWVKSLEYHWFSTMYGVWYFANCARGALAAGILIMIWLYFRGDYKGVLNKNHWYSIGLLSFAFTVFWGYITFSQYFLIWNANIPEETFWYNVREVQNSDGTPNQWKWVGFTLLFGHFFFPFLALISYPAKISKTWMRFMACWILAIFLLDVIYNVWPAKKNPLGDPLPFLYWHQIWTLTAVIGVGGICVWSYLKSFPTAKLIPVRDPRIGESLTYHE